MFESLWNYVNENMQNFLRLRVPNMQSQKEYDLKEIKNQNDLIKRIEKQLTSGDCSNLFCWKSKLSSLFVSNSVTKDKCINICF